MPNDTTAGFWHELAASDRAAHANEAERAAQVENEQLRLRNAELAAALTQARAAITVRHQLLADQTVAIAERDRALAEAREQAEQLQAFLSEVLSSRRWQAGEAVSTVARAPLSVLRRLRRRS